MKRFLVFSFYLLVSSCVFAQGSAVRQQTRQGNREYNRGHYDQAEVHYRRALSGDSTAYRARHNLGSALYRAKNYSEAARHYEMALREPSLDKKTRSGMLHNRGNCHLQAGLQKERAEAVEDFRQAVADYQEALKLDPKNDDTRYNLSYAMKLLQQAQQQQQQQGGGGDKNQQDKQNQQEKKDQQDKQDQQNQQDQQNRQNQQNQQNQNQQQQQNQNRQQQGQQGQQGERQKKQDAERLLEAVKNNEKSSLKEHARRVEAGSPRRIEKDW